MSTLYSVGSMNQFADALEVAGFSPGNLTELRSSPDILKQLMKVLSGQSEIVAIKYTIDLDADPFSPNGWKVKKHIQDGQFEWDPKKVALYQYKGEGREIVQGQQLCEELEDKPVFNANLLDFLLDHQNLIPNEWMSHLVFFWGTLYRNLHDLTDVRCLVWSDSKWKWRFGLYIDGCRDYFTAAVPTHTTY